MKPVKLLFIIALLCTAFTQSRAVTLASWAFTNASGDWGTSPKTPTSSADNITIVGLTRGSGVGTSGTAAGTAWGGNTFFDGLAAASQTQTTAITNNNFITLSFTANPGFSLSLTQIPAYNIRRSSTGPSFMIWQYSLDGSSFTDIGTSITIGTNTASAGNPQSAITLSGIAALQNVPSGTMVTLRAVMWGSSQDAGTWYLNGNGGGTFSVTGDVNSTPLGLDLISFKGQAGNSVNQLDWITANEQNVSRFELQRGTDGEHFEKIAVVRAKGNDKAANNYYNYRDESAAAIDFYRLLMIDMDGTVTYSNVVMLRNGVQQQNIRIYPNPASTTLFIEGLVNASSYSITDVSGRSIVAATFIYTENKAASIDISSLNEGVYFLQLLSDGNMQTIRFVKK